MRITTVADEASLGVGTFVAVAGVFAIVALVFVDTTESGVIDHVSIGTVTCIASISINTCSNSAVYDFCSRSAN